MAEALVELSKWKIDALEVSAISLVGLYVKHLSFLGTKDWFRFAVRYLAPSIKFQCPGPVNMRTMGFGLTYYPPRPDLTNATFRELEPRFVISDFSLHNLMPRERTRFYKTTLEIAGEIGDTDKLVFDRNSSVFLFPKSFYAESSFIARVPLMG